MRVLDCCTFTKSESKEFKYVDENKETEPRYAQPTSKKDEKEKSDYETAEPPQW